MAIRLTHQPGDYLDPANRQVRIEAHLSTGGMGTVYRAVDCFTGAVKAVKECDLLDDPRGKQLSRADAVAGFLHEARCMEDLKHPGIPAGNLVVVPQSDLRLCTSCGNRVTEVRCTLCDPSPDSLYFTPQTVDRRYYLVMEYIDGDDLDTLVGAMARPLAAEDLRRLCGWLADAAAVLSYVHEQGLAHCDVKPENLRVRREDGRLFLLDFGLQRVESGKTRVLTPAHLPALGTPGYAAPEQEQGHPGKPADIYALSMTAAHLLTGMDPGRPDQRTQLLRDKLRTHVPVLSEGLEALVYEGLSMNAALRPDAPRFEQVLRTVEPLAVQAPVVVAGRAGTGQATAAPAATPAAAAARGPRRLWPVMGLVLFLGIAVYALLVPHEKVGGTTGVAQRNAAIYKHPDKAELVRRLAGGEALELREAPRAESGYWFKVVRVAGQPADGYMERGDFQMDKPRGVTP